ncbi:hypothetical protein B0T21DRAFT_168268 [Apiosordaria backusii]|uniref:Uncharacterized protein n=1 Tax=Apiosordaria backusii TaxID=314023 RepID=A0AA40BNP4_9PEZI|nr:hypothetical protein B0T21DRAFT_168268 [Apiosordaria backusii]
MDRKLHLIFPLSLPTLGTYIPSFPPHHVHKHQTCNSLSPRKSQKAFPSIPPILHTGLTHSRQTSVTRPPTSPQDRTIWPSPLVGALNTHLSAITYVARRSR